MFSSAKWQQLTLISKGKRDNPCKDLMSTEFHLSLSSQLFLLETCNLNNVERIVSLHLLYSSAQAAITEGLRWLQQHRLIFSGCSLRSGCPQGWFLVRPFLLACRWHLLAVSFLGRGLAWCPFHFL